MRRIGALLALWLAGCAPPVPPATAPPAAPQRIVSLDYCADQFVLKLADRAQIAALSTSADSAFSYMRARAAGLPQVRPRAEDVLGLRPDLVVRSYGGEANIAALLARARTPLAQLAYGEDFEAVRGNIRAMAAAFGHPERGEALVAEMDARLAAIRPAQRRTALYMTPAGFTTGPGSLVDELLRAAGLENFETAPGWRPLPLERLAGERPDMVATGFFDTHSTATDSWSSARHPLARRQLQARPVVALDGAWIACGGWFLVDAVEALAAPQAMRR